MRVCSYSFKRSSCRGSGFTLIELLIVIAIILILIAIALPSFLEAQIRAKVARAKADIRSISIGQEVYYQDRKVYTDDCLGTNPGCIQLTTPIKYMATVPPDPFGRHKSSDGNWSFLGGFDGVRILAFYHMGTGTWGNESYVKATRALFGSPSIRDTYIIYSAGPTFNQWEPGGPTGIFPQPQEECHWTMYSPTNGTTSYGGIIRTGGSLPPAYKRLQYGQ